MLTYDETMILAIYNTGTRTGTKDALVEMRAYLELDETDLRELTNTAIRKLEAMSDEEYVTLDLIPDFDEGEETDAG